MHLDVFYRVIQFFILNNYFFFRIDRQIRQKLKILSYLIYKHRNSFMNIKI